jgi:prefoldin subunit 5
MATHKDRMEQMESNVQEIRDNIQSMQDNIHHLDANVSRMQSMEDTLPNIIGMLSKSHEQRFSTTEKTPINQE